MKVCHHFVTKRDHLFMTFIRVDYLSIMLILFPAYSIKEYILFCLPELVQTFLHTTLHFVAPFQQVKQVIHTVQV